ncbi:hypothetical protein [Halorubrum distributum]|uniref:hypothetical protein n=1 Tax=Halorubrum distributum TaxID=29283 RepID=UPI0012672A9C|nr:hypothetical protein [Halorubrum distributum]
MDRRQLLAGLAALAAGGGAATGTGAFTSVNADRDVAVEVADDASAYLQIFPSGSQPNAQFASQDPDEGVFFDFNGSPQDVDGVGSGQSSVYEFRDVVRVENAGTQNAFISIDSLTIDLTDDDGSPGDEGSALVEFYVHETAEDPSTDLQVIDGSNADLVAPVGEQRAIGVRIDTNEEGTYGDIEADVSANGGSDTTTLVADQTASSNNAIDPGLPNPNSVSPP